MASNFRHLTGCEDGTGTLRLLLPESRGASASESRTGRRAPKHSDHDQGDADCLIDDPSVNLKLLSFVCLFVDASFSSRINHRPRAACRVLKADVLREKNRHGTRAVRSTIEDGRCPSSFAYCEAEFDLGKGKNRSKAPYPHGNDEDNNHHWHTNPNSHEYESESQSEVDVRWTAADRQCVDPVPVCMHSCHGAHDQLKICWPSEGL